VHRRLSVGAAAAVAAGIVCAWAVAQGPTTIPPSLSSSQFAFHRPGDLEGDPQGLAEKGVEDWKVRFPHMGFPIAFNPATQIIPVNSQMHGFGGLCHAAPCNDTPPQPQPADGVQTDPKNFSFPWRDTFCEDGGRGARSKNHNPQCTHDTKLAHQGVDIRPPTNDAGVYDAIAVEPGKVTVPDADGHIVRLNGADSGTEYVYRHLAIGSITVRSGTRVERGDVLGKVGKVLRITDKGPEYTTPHLHLEALIRQDTGSNHPFPVYSSLLYAYTRRVGIGLPVTPSYFLEQGTPWEVPSPR
jgi:peptidase M23-like protein